MRELWKRALKQSREWVWSFCRSKYTFGQY
jgi:hypothetical protein